MDEDQVAALLAKTERAAAAADSRVKLKLDENIPASLKAQSLLQDAQGKFQEAVLDIYEKHIGIERTAGVRAHGIQNPFNRCTRSGTRSNALSEIWGMVYSFSNALSFAG